MELISTKAKRDMEECKKRARDAGLSFDDDSLEYIVTNRDLLNLTPKNMIPSMYDYWVQDLQNIRAKNVYKVFPSNPYETVINTRPAISFYNDNNPDWLNIMIFYHVLGHIDFFQNNEFFAKTWGNDFCGQALADKRCIARIREELGERKRWADYVVEFSRGIDNLVGYHAELNDSQNLLGKSSKKFLFYFGPFLEEAVRLQRARQSDFQKELDKFNQLTEQHGKKRGEEIFFQDVGKNFLEFAAVFAKHQEEKQRHASSKDLLAYLINHSPMINKVGKNIDNRWMREVVQIVRDTSLYFQPQIRTKTINEGWASLWHRELFINDDRISGHEVDFAYVDSRVLSMPRVGINPYAIGCRLLSYIKEMADKGKLSVDFQKVKDVVQRRDWNLKTGLGIDKIFDVRKTCDDFGLYSFLSLDDFQDFVDKNKLFVAGKKLVFGHGGRPAVQYFIKSRNGEDYRQMLIDSLYHPPRITFKEDRRSTLYLNHKFEGKPLVTEYIPAVLIGTSYLWGGTVKLETTEFEVSQDDMLKSQFDPDFEPKIKKKRVLYVVNRRRKPSLERKVL